ncbi:VOC family protein [Nocardia nova]|uniref:VOC family protein n=1 Tax=Nocardia nova TaxID=37330 RepID=UPI000CEA20B9|nr:VOC family protein [Nocardia nova]PPJ33499.1 lactoylglutathione lyase [Nocardia nova]
MSSGTATDLAGGGVTLQRDAVAHHAHAVLHCNLNTAAVERSSAFHMALFGLDPRMRSVSKGGDSATMGLGDSTDSVTSFLFDARGPRSAPALELVGWSRPQTEPAEPGMVAPILAALGFRVASLAVFEKRLKATGVAFVSIEGGLMVRGRKRAALRFADPDGVAFEVVEMVPADTDPQWTALLSHERMRCSDLSATIAWYEGIGWQVRSRDEVDDRATASLILPEDPTFSLELIEIPAVSGTPRAANTQGLYRIALAVDNVREAYDSLVDSGAHGAVPEPVVFSMPDIPTGGFEVLFLADPDGGVVELVERPRETMRRPQEPR